MKVLFMGGSGNISSACVELALARGYDVTVFNRGRRPMAFDGRVRSIIGDRNDLACLREVAESGPYDVVADFVGYTPDQIEKDIAAFAGCIGQYVYISSASAYQKPPNHYVITESTPLVNPYWQYSRDKIACEDRLMQAHREQGFPITIVRPTYTYGPTWVPSAIGGQDYTVVNRMRQGKPIICHGDGTALWVMTHHSDFAVGFVGLFGNARALGEAFHITSDEVLTWDQIYTTIGRAAGVEPVIVHLASETIAKLYPDVGAGLLGDKAHSVVFDNSKIKRAVPEFHTTVSFAEGMRRSLAWLDADPAHQRINPKADQMIDHLVSVARSLPVAP
ncbi:MAG TPA: SDR family oxidoreductase [Chloroflexi bacterium]|jgi:nucleoside-diphosphate-sugar epimerase|nr:SDR family oxidoreductase [Chloroflexota bacterium]